MLGVNGMLAANGEEISQDQRRVHVGCCAYPALGGLAVPDGSQVAADGDRVFAEYNEEISHGIQRGVHVGCCAYPVLDRSPLHNVPEQPTRTTTSEHALGSDGGSAATGVTGFLGVASFRQRAVHSPRAYKKNRGACAYWFLFSVCVLHIIIERIIIYSQLCTNIWDLEVGEV